MNNDQFTRFSSSFSFGNEFPYPQFPEMNMEQHEELTFNSYYSSVQSVQNTTTNGPGFYRPYDIAGNNNNEEWPSISGTGSYNGIYNTGGVGNRNATGNNYSTDYNVEAPSTWAHYPESAFSHYSHYSNVNFWPQLYFQQATYESHARESRYPLPQDSTFIDDNNGQVYELNGERTSSDSPEVASAPLPPLPSITFPTNVTSLPVQTNNPPYLPQYESQPQPQLPIRPIPQQATTDLTSFQCPACLRFCISAGGLKRHAKFCRASQTNLDNIFASLKRPEETAPSASLYCGPTNAHPINLSSSYDMAQVYQQPTNNSAPVNIRTNQQTVQRVSEAHGKSVANNNISNNEASVAPTAPTTAASSSSTFVAPGPSTDNSGCLEIFSESPSTPGSPPRKRKVSSSSVNGRKRACSLCQLVLPSERALVDHLTTHNVDKPYECATCGSHFSRKFHLTRHVKQRGCDGTPRAQFPCEFCKKMFSRKDNLREHIKSHTGQSRPRTKLPCPIPSCNKEFQGKTQLQVHLNYHSGVRPYACDRDDCEKTFRSNAALKKHLRIHNSQKPFQCPQCDIRFAAKETLARHMETHDLLRPIKSFICNRCGMAFIQQTQLKEHIIKEHHTDDVEVFGCTACSRTYKRRWRLQQHFRLEHIEKKPPLSHQSPAVEKKTPPSLQSTAAPGNSGNGSYTCGVCSKVFLTRHLLKVHYVTHVVETPGNSSYTCGVCSKVFQTKNSLKVHYVTHVVETPVACTECSRAYIRKDCLIRHLRTKHRLLPEEALQVMENMNVNHKSSSEETDGRTDTTYSESVVESSCSTQSANEPQDPTPTLDDEIIDVSILEGNIIELLSLLVDPNALRNFGWPTYSVDIVLQSVLVKCGKTPLSNPNISLAQRLRANTKLLFSFIVDDQTALENLFARRPVEQVLQQVIQLAKSSAKSDNVVQLPI